MYRLVCGYVGQRGSQRDYMSTYHSESGVERWRFPAPLSASATHHLHERKHKVRKQLTEGRLVSLPDCLTVSLVWLQ